MSDIAGMDLKSYTDAEGKTRWYYQTSNEAALDERLMFQTRESFPLVYVEMPHPYIHGAKRGYYMRKDHIEKDPGFEIARLEEWKGVQLELWREK